MIDHAGMCLPDIHSVDELKQRLIQVWCNLDQDINRRDCCTMVQEDFKHVFMQMAIISNTPYEFTMTYSV